VPQDFYTLEQAAERLGVATDRLSEMSRKREVRSFLDRGTLRFRKQEIDELARQRGMGSDVELQLGDSSVEQQPAAPMPGSGSDVVPFRPGEDSGQVVFPAPKSAPKLAPGSDNEVKLVNEGSAIQLSVGDQSASSTSAINLGGHKGGKHGDSGNLVTDDDSDVKLVDEGSVVNLGGDEYRAGSDSDVRLEELGSGSSLLPDSGVRLVDDRPKSGKGKKSDVASPTEEINLDEELRRMEEALSPSEVKKTVEQTSPFEVAKTPPSSKQKKPDSSSDFDFSAALPPKSDSSVEIDLGRDVTGGGASGINLGKPSDSGRSLTDSSEEESITFELEPEQHATKAKTPPRGQPAPAEIDSSSEFELTLDDESGVGLKADSSSRPIKSDIGLKDDSGSDELKLGPSSSGEMNLDTSDFELALDEEPNAEGAETGSEVIVIDEGAEENDATAVRPEALDALEAEEIPELTEEEELSVEAAADEEDAVVPSGPVVEAAPADWGFWSILHLPTALVLLFVGFLLIEMMRSIWSYNQPTLVGSKIFEMFAGMLK